MLDFSKLWDKVYLLGPNPLELSRSDRIFFWIAAVFVVLAVLAKIGVLRQPKDSPRRLLFSRFFHKFATIGILVLVWFTLRFENIPWLSTHIVVVFLVLVWLTWLMFIARYFFSRFRKAQKLWEDEALKRRYLK